MDQCGSGNNLRFKEMCRYIKMTVPETMYGPPRQKSYFHTCGKYERICHTFYKYERICHTCDKYKGILIPVYMHFVKHFVPVKISKNDLCICHTFKNVIYSCEFFTHMWHIRSVKNKVQHGSYDVLDWIQRYETLGDDLMYDPRTFYTK